MYVCTCECKYVHPSRGKGSISGVFSLYFLPLFFKQDPSLKLEMCSQHRVLGIQYQIHISV